MTTYLCGGINGLSDADCRDWREVAKTQLVGATLDPMRRDYRGKEDDSVREIVEGDIADIRASDVVLVNATRASWGTAMEVFFAHSIGKRVVAWVGDARISPWLRYHCVSVHVSFADAVAAVNAGARM